MCAASLHHRAENLGIRNHYHRLSGWNLWCDRINVFSTVAHLEFISASLTLGTCAMVAVVVLCVCVCVCVCRDEKKLKMLGNGLVCCHIEHRLYAPIVSYLRSRVAALIITCNMHY